MERSREVKKALLSGAKGAGKAGKAGAGAQGHGSGWRCASRVVGVIGDFRRTSCWWGQAAQTQGQAMSDLEKVFGVHAVEASLRHHPVKG